MKQFVRFGNNPNLSWAELRTQLISLSINFEIVVLTKEVAILDIEDELDATEATGTEYREPGPALEEEYNPNDEEAEEDEDADYGWGYNDGFDKPEEEESDDLLDEDELYAKGLAGDDDDDY